MFLCLAGPLGLVGSSQAHGRRHKSGASIRQNLVQSCLLHESISSSTRVIGVHGHCHQKALVGMKSEQNLLNGMGLDAEVLDSGCCGLAGSFGYEEGHYEVSMRIGERVLLPRIRSAEKSTLIVADGFSCREQIMHGTERHGMHLAEVIQMALHQPVPVRKNRAIETGWVQETPSYPIMTATAGAGLLIAGGLFLFSKTRNL